MKPRCYSYLRFSDPDQEKGDSARRQIELSEKYAHDHSLELDDTLRLQDRGLSAFHGQHRTKGALGIFLRLVEEGEIPKDSILIVESLDRLSREQVLDALQYFTSIVRAGIKVVTLLDNMEYTEESLNANIGQLIVSLTIMSRAHEESLTKSIRGQQAWGKKRELARRKEKRLTDKCPDWLRPQEHGDWFDKIEERCEMVERIFRMKLDGKGPQLIEKELNQGAGWKPENGWRKSYINKILRNRAVIGEFQPNRRIAGIREPVGEPITDYYPSVIPHELFYRVQEQLSRNKHYGGRTGKVRNLFGHIAKCLYCGAPMRYDNKGQGPKGGQYLVCDNAARGRGCDYLTIRYEEFERLILNYCKGLTVDDLLPSTETSSELTLLKSQLSATIGELGQVKDRIDNLTDSIADTPDKQVRRTLEKRLSELLGNQERLSGRQSEIETEIASLSQASDKIRKQLHSVDQLWEYMHSVAEEDRIDVRLRLRDRLRQLIKVIHVGPVGVIRMTPELVEESMREQIDMKPELEGSDALEKIKEEYTNAIDNKELRWYLVVHEGGIYRSLSPVEQPQLWWEYDRKDGKLGCVIDDQLKSLPTKSNSS
jgi:DNA invertase Pin-like site-specific DNA recombinase